MAENRHMQAAVISCSSLAGFVDEAQRRQGTCWPVVVLDKKFHTEPEEMKQRFQDAVRRLPPEIDTVLTAMAFCGGVFDHVVFDRRIVIPRADDCVSILLYTGADASPNLKQTGHLYLYEKEPADFSALRILRDQEAEDALYYGKDPAWVRSQWLAGYGYMDIIDTGATDCYSEAYAAAAQEEADRIGAVLDYVPGSLTMLEDLVAGRFEERFLDIPPGTMIRHGDFF